MNIRSVEIKSNFYFLVFALLSTMYVQLNAEELQDRAWFNTSLDLVIGAMLIFLVLEATRESFGSFVPVLAILTVIYPFFGQHFPEPFYSTSLPIKKTIANLSICLSRGIYGTALSVSATYIFLWVVFGSVLQAWDGDENKGVSHGMCQDCYKEQVIMLDETEHYYIVS